MLLLQSNPTRVSAAFRVIASTIPRESMGILVDILSVSWIDAEMAALLLVAAGRQPGRRAAALNASMHEFTTKALIARACGLWPTSALAVHPDRSI